MKSLALIFSVVLLSLSSFAKSNDTYNWLFQDMKKAEAKAETVSAPKHGEYFFGDNEARMLIYDEASIVHSLQVKHEGQLKHFAVASEDDKRALRDLIDKGAQADAMATYVVQNVEVDGVVFKLIALLPKHKSTILEFRGAQYSGVRAKTNRTITFSSDMMTGALVKGEIYQVSLTTLLQPEVLPLVIR